MDVPKTQSVLGLQSVGFRGLGFRGFGVSGFRVSGLGFRVSGPATLKLKILNPKPHDPIWNKRS